jgi:hypothetical protein
MGFLVPIALAVAASKSGVGKQTFSPTQQKVDPNAASFGGDGGTKYDENGNMVQFGEADKQLLNAKHLGQSAYLQAQDFERQQKSGVPSWLGGRINYNATNADAMRAEELNALDMNRRAAMGLGPSLAQSQYNNNLNQGINAGRSLAASAQGPLGQASAMRRASMQQNSMLGQANLDTAMLRAQEDQANRAAYTQGAGAIRNQDEQRAATMAQGALQHKLGVGQIMAGHQANLINARLAAERQRTDTAEHRRGIARDVGQLGLGREAANIGAYDSWARGQADLDKANSDREMTWLKAGMSAIASQGGQGGGNAGSSPGMKTGITPIKSGMSVNASGHQSFLPSGKSILNQILGIGGDDGGGSGGGPKADTSHSNVGNAMVTDSKGHQSFLGGGGGGDSGQNANPTGMSGSAMGGLGGAATGVTDFLGGLFGKKPDPAREERKWYNQNYPHADPNGGIFAAGPSEQMVDTGANYGTMTSDPDRKSNVHRVDDSPLSAAARSIQPVAFNYKQGVYDEDPYRRHFGILTTDLQKTPVGSSIVEPGPQGDTVSVKHGMTLALAQNANLQRQIDEMRRRGG